ncbi:MAG: 3-deoxy-7-phosphoheptulonate synthase, partial [Coriobacteriales bacterium]
MNMNFERKLPIPMEVKEMYPLSAKGADLVERRRIELEKIFTGKDERIVLIIGPCSADNEDSVMDYITRLAGLQQRVFFNDTATTEIYTN